VRAAVVAGLEKFGWVAALGWGTQALRLATLTVLAWLLAPADFGIFAFAAAIITFVQPIIGLGGSSAIVLRTRLEPGDVASVFWLAMAGAIPLSLLLALLAGPVMRLGHAEGAAALLAAMAVSLPLSGASTILLAVPRRARNFRLLAITGLVSELIASLCAVLVALGGGGAWSLAVRQIVNQALLAASGAWAARAAIGDRPSLVRGRAMSALGRPVAAGQLVILARERLDELLVGMLFGSAFLGFYSVGRRYVEAVTSLAPGLVMNRAWPVFAALAQDRRGFARELLDSLHLIVGLGWPGYVLLAGLAPLWVPIMLGSHWLPIVPVLIALSLVAMARMVVGIALTAMITAGFAGRRLLFEIAITILSYAALAIGSSHGSDAAIGALAATVLLAAPIELAVISRVLPVTFGDQLRVMAPSIAAAAIVAGLAVTGVRIVAPVAGPIAAIAMTALLALAVVAAFMASAVRKRRASPA